MRLPQEICDFIIEKLAAQDKSTLHSCALVCRGWVHRSRAHLFNFITLEDKRFRYWLDTFSSSDGHIHSLVEGLILCPPEVNAPPCDFMRIAEYAPAFKNLQHLLDGWRSPYESQPFPFIRWFGHLRNTLKSLELCRVAVNPLMIAAFPRLEYLLF